MELGMGVIQTKHANCPVCALGLTIEFQELIFLKKLDYHMSLKKIIEATGCQYLTIEDLEKHITRHVGLIMNMQQQEVAKMSILNERIQRVKDKLFEMENRGEIYSKGYESLNSTLVQLLRLLNDIDTGTTDIAHVKMPVRKFFYE